MHPLVALSRKVYQKGGDTAQAGDAGGGGPPGVPPGVALLGYSDPTSFTILSQDILFDEIA